MIYVEPGSNCKYSMIVACGRLCMKLARIADVKPYQATPWHRKSPKSRKHVMMGLKVGVLDQDRVLLSGDEFFEGVGAERGSASTRSVICVSNLSLDKVIEDYLSSAWPVMVVFGAFVRLVWSEKEFCPAVVSLYSSDMRSRI